jgi:DNA-binding transcriptional MerR regulator
MHLAGAASSIRSAESYGIDRNGKIWHSRGVTMRAPQPTPETPVELSADELAGRANLPVRTIREYQTMGLLPPPERRGRVGVYGASHLIRLELIGRLRARGYALAGIRDLLESWRDGGDLGEVLGLTPDQLVHAEEPGTPATAAQLARLLPEFVPERIHDLIATGVVEVCGPEYYCVPSPSLLQLTKDAIAAGYDQDAVVHLLGTINRAADTIAEAVVEVMADRPAGATTEQLVALATRGRGLLAHGTGRLTVHALGKRLGITDEAAVSDALRRLLEVDQ